MSTELPSWLEETHAPSTTSPTQSTQRGISPYRELQFENFFEGALDRIALGHELTDICDDDPRKIGTVEFMRWIKKDKERYSRYKESLEIGSEILLSTVLPVAYGRDSMNDVNRDKLIVDATFKYMAFANPKRFGKEAGLPNTTGGSGGITINIGQVESPYALVNSPAVVSDISENVTDVEPK